MVNALVTNFMREHMNIQSVVAIEVPVYSTNYMRERAKLLKEPESTSQ